MLLAETEILQFINQYYLPFVRIGAMFMVAPIFGAKIVNSKIRLFLALILAVVTTPLLPAIPQVPILSLQSISLVVQEILIGISVGFVFQIVFQVFVLSGQIMAMKMGLGFASMNDPTNGVQTTVLSQFFLMLVTLMFVSVNGHLVLISLVVESFKTLPIGSGGLPAASYQELAKLGGWMFASALVIALPITTALLFVNIAFGVMSRAAPQLNIFAVGFPFTLVVGILLIWIGLNGFDEKFSRTTDYGFMFIHGLLGVK